MSNTAPEGGPDGIDGRQGWVAEITDIVPASTGTRPAGDWTGVPFLAAPCESQVDRNIGSRQADLHQGNRPTTPSSRDSLTGRVARKGVFDRVPSGLTDPAEPAGGRESSAGKVSGRSHAPRVIGVGEWENWLLAEEFTEPSSPGRVNGIRRRYRMIQNEWKPEQETVKYGKSRLPSGGRSVRENQGEVGNGSEESGAETRD